MGAATVDGARRGLASFDTRAEARKAVADAGAGARRLHRTGKPGMVMKDEGKRRQQRFVDREKENWKVKVGA